MFTLQVFIIVIVFWLLREFLLQVVQHLFELMIDVVDFSVEEGRRVDQDHVGVNAIFQLPVREKILFYKESTENICLWLQICDDVCSC